MDESTAKGVKKLSLSSTKKELLDAYLSALKQLEEKSKTELQPQKMAEEKKKTEAIKKADELSLEGVAGAIGALKLEMSRILTQLSDRLENEVNNYKNIQSAIALKNQELKEIYDIENSASTLAALIEAQKQKRREFEEQIARDEETLMNEVREARKKWTEEEKQHELTMKERAQLEQKMREREREEYIYNFNREQKLEKDRFEDLKAKLEKEMALKKEEVERELSQREKMIAEKEAEVADLREKVMNFPKQLEVAVAKAVKETTENLKVQAKSREDLLLKEFEGEKNVLNTKMAILEKLAAEQGEKIKELSDKLEKAYGKIQDVAVKAIEGASQAKSFTDLQRILAEKPLKAPLEKEK